MLRCHAGQHTVRPIDRAIPQKPGDQDSRNVAEEFSNGTTRPWRDSDRPLNVKEALTCGLQNSDSPTSDHVTPQETTTQKVGATGLDGDGLPWPGSSVVAENGGEDAELNLESKSLVGSLLENSQEKGSSTKGDDF